MASTLHHHHQHHHALILFHLFILLQILSITAFPIEVPSYLTSRSKQLLGRQSNTIPSITSLPDYALQYAPVMYLHSEEQWFPTDVKTFLTQVVPLDSSRAAISSTSPTFASLSSYTSTTYLSSINDITTLSDPSWLNSDDCKPDPALNGSSKAPIEIIVAPKEGGIVDVFYFVFFAYNHGTEVLGTSFGNHLGDWEHTMIRFQDNLPTSIYLSQHNDGVAYEWNAILKKPDGRPTVYIGLGDHACYAMPGTQVYDDFLTDQTDAGTSWDTSLNYRSYLFDSTSGQFSFLNSTSSSTTSSSASATSNTTAAQSAQDIDEVNEGVEWLTYSGSWGDKEFDDDDKRQFCVFGHCRYTDGPLGPYLKNLGRKDVCQAEDGCVVRQTL